MNVHIKNYIDNAITHPITFIPEENSWQGAVCLLIVDDSIFFVSRSQTMPTHKGQISFIGGHRETGEFSPVDTCYREFEEETGFNRNLLRPHGVMNKINTLGKEIYPVICSASISKDSFLKDVKSNGEWDNAISYPIEKLSKNDLWSYAQVKRTNYYELYFYPLLSANYHSTNCKIKENYCLWGASAKMTLNFLGLSLHNADSQKG
jgi:8-oxo-dGTP pyrophosphatase MutT (NUDIX family)